MRRLFACILCAALLGSARADDTQQTITPAEAQLLLTVIPGRLGYAVDQPEILIRQRLFGLAHGLSLLAAACLDLPAYSQLIQDAYADWHAKQRKTIGTIVQDLAQYYFGPRADEAQWPDLSRALNLKDSIEPALGEVTLHAACASLPAAIVRPRYELDRMLVEGIDPAVKEAAAPAVPPGAVTSPGLACRECPSGGRQSGNPSTQSESAPTPGPPRE
ncbi:MAG: hypothetical protein D4R84_15615 [Rhodocyclaceae bacterium]|nr:MAG: hypothetical protein D4R84_15615 [Rhodocyclaceae bacterium]